MHCYSRYNYGTVGLEPEPLNLLDVRNWQGILEQFVEDSPNFPHEALIRSPATDATPREEDFTESLGKC